MGDQFFEASSFFAHSAEGKPVNSWQRLEDHLLNVANLARSFAEEFSAGEWAYLAGLWHDLSKLMSDCQSFIHYAKKKRGPDYALQDNKAACHTSSHRPDRKIISGEYHSRDMQRCFSCFLDGESKYRLAICI